VSKLNRFNFEIAELAADPECAQSTVVTGLYVTPEYTSVTDGHMAVWVSSVKEDQPNLFGDMDGIEPADFFTPFILDQDTALRVAKALPKKQDGDHPISAIVDATTENNERAMVSVPDVGRQEIQKSRKIEGKFPDILAIFPDPAKANLTVSLSPSLLLQLLKTIEKFCSGHGCDRITVGFHGDLNMVRIDAQAFNQTLIAALMPWRDS